MAELLGRHKSWVCRRLALIERLGTEAREELRVRLLSPSAARQMVRLPEGNQAAVLQVVRREALSGAELTGVEDLLLECPGRERGSPRKIEGSCRRASKGWCARPDRSPRRARTW